MGITNRVLEGFQPIKRLVPPVVKAAAKRALLDHLLRRAVRSIAALALGEVPSRELLAQLQTGWSNEGFAAGLDYIEEVARRAAEVRGAVLECGSGLTTLLLGLLAGRRGFEVWSLEHHPEWHARVSATVEAQRVPNVRVVFAPLRAYGGFSWYDPPLGEMPREFRLVVCDGPPGTTPGGRYGLLPVMGGRLPAGSLILLDDANRAEERGALARWWSEAGVSVDRREKPEGVYALVTR